MTILQTLFLAIVLTTWIVAIVQVFRNDALRAPILDRRGGKSRNFLCASHGRTRGR